MNASQEYVVMNENTLTINIFDSVASLFSRNAPSFFCPYRPGVSMCSHEVQDRLAP